ncbi:MAG TPA: hypothetical protein VGG33_03005 [Polyangia bacterium]
MKTTKHLTRAFVLIPCLVLLLLPACGAEEPTNEPQPDSVSQRLDNRPGEISERVSSYAAELSADGTQYCAKEQPKLCAPAAARSRGRFACHAEGRDCNANPQDFGCVCCYWVPGSWPFEIRCGSWPLFP